HGSHSFVGTFSTRHHDDRHLLQTQVLLRTQAPADTQTINSRRLVLQKNQPRSSRLHHSHGGGCIQGMSGSHAFHTRRLRQHKRQSRIGNAHEHRRILHRWSGRGSGGGVAA